MKESEILKRIYPSVVTYQGDWQQMMKDVAKFNLKEISLFLTTVGFLERQKIYQALEKTKVKNIPHVHARHDMREEELDFFVSKYKTQAFTIHFQHFSKIFKNSKHKNKIFIENNNGKARIKNLVPFKQVGGICVDLAHLGYFQRRLPKDYQLIDQVVKKYRVGCNHLSAVLDNGFSWHKVNKISDLDYLENIPKYFFSRYINIELINPIKEQLEFKKYIAKILVKTWNKES